MTGDAETLRDGRYALVRLLGQGNQGETLEAVDKVEGRLVAVKRFRVRGASGWKDVELAEREARVLSGLSHPALPRYIEHFEENGCLYLVMERIEGQPLSEARLDRRDIVRFLHEASALLDYLHGRSPPVIHRDLKPNNVIVRPDGSFCFVDFGSVRDHLKPEGSTVVGTFGYMAPEQFQGRALPASDVFAIGATCLWLLTGVSPDKLPHRGLTIDVRKVLQGQVEEPWIRVLERLVDPDPDRRPTRIAPVLAEHGLRADAPHAAHHSARTQTSGSRGPHARAGREQARRRDRYDWDAHDGYSHDPHDWAEWHSADRSRRRHREDGRRWRARRGHPLAYTPFFPIVLLVLLLGLTVARIATWALFNVFLPTLLGILSVFFSPKLAEAADTCHEIGDRGRRALRRAQVRLRNLKQPIEASRGAEEEPRRRHRVDEEPAPRRRVDEEQASPRVRVVETEGEPVADEAPWQPRRSTSRR